MTSKLYYFLHQNIFCAWKDGAASDRHKQMWMIVTFSQDRTSILCLSWMCKAVWVLFSFFLMQYITNAMGASTHCFFPPLHPVHNAPDCLLLFFSPYFSTFCVFVFGLFFCFVFWRLDSILLQVAEEQQNPSAAWFRFLRMPGAGEIVSRSQSRLFRCLRGDDCDADLLWSALEGKEWWSNYKSNNFFLPSVVPWPSLFLPWAVIARAMSGQPFFWWNFMDACHTQWAGLHIVRMTALLRGRKMLTSASSLIFLSMGHRHDAWKAGLHYSPECFELTFTMFRTWKKEALFSCFSFPGFCKTTACARYPNKPSAACTI